MEVTMSCFAVWKRNGIIPCSIIEQTVLEHGHIQSDVITCTTGCDNVWLEQWEITATIFYVFSSYALAYVLTDQGNLPHSPQ